MFLVFNNGGIKQSDVTYLAVRYVYSCELMGQFYQSLGDAENNVLSQLAQLTRCMWWEKMVSVGHLCKTITTEAYHKNVLFIGSYQKVLFVMKAWNGYSCR